MATVTLVNDLFEDLMNGVHSLSSDTIQVALSNTAPAAEASVPTADGNGVLANVTQISYANYTDDLTVDRVLEGVAATLISGTSYFDANDFTITASGGALATFQYVYVFNQTAAGDPLIAVWDHGSGITLADGESVEVDFGADSGTDGDIFTLASA